MNIPDDFKFKVAITGADDIIYNARLDYIYPFKDSRDYIKLYIITWDDDGESGVTVYNDFAVQEALTDGDWVIVE
jgi:hypothetical protein